MLRITYSRLQSRFCVSFWYTLLLYMNIYRITHLQRIINFPHNLLIQPLWRFGLAQSASCTLCTLSVIKKSNNDNEKLSSCTVINKTCLCTRPGTGICGSGVYIKLMTLRNQTQGFPFWLPHIPAEAYISTFVQFKLGAIHPVILTETLCMI